MALRNASSQTKSRPTVRLSEVLRHCQKGITHLAPEQLAESILAKERRIAEIPGNVKGLWSMTSMRNTGHQLTAESNQVRREDAVGGPCNSLRELPSNASPDAGKGARSSRTEENCGKAPPGGHQRRLAVYVSGMP